MAIRRVVDVGTYDTAFTIQIRINLLLRRRLVQIPTADTYPKRDGLLFRVPGDILPDGDTRINTPPFFKESADGATGTFGGDEDDVDSFWRNDVCVFFVDD
jgi:hypothetical protein